MTGKIARKFIAGNMTSKGVSGMQYLSPQSFKQNGAIACFTAKTMLISADVNKHSPIAF